MKFKQHRRFVIYLSVLLLGVSIAIPADAANRNSSWGWAKPLNERPGSLLYTTNRAAKGPSNVRSRGLYQPAYSARPGYGVSPTRTSPQFFPRFRR